jgi:hypothetical protein
MTYEQGRADERAAIVDELKKNLTSRTPPMDKATLLALADRVEALAGADRSINSDICAALGDTFNRAYTTSVDCALTLIPDGWEYCITPHNGSWVRRNAHLPTTHGSGPPPSAITAAALRAIAGGLA